MQRWKTWETKNNKYRLWFQQEPSKAFFTLWDILQKKTMDLVPNSSRENDILLDVGCGDGRYLVSSIKDKGYYGVGIDPNYEVSLMKAKKKITIEVSPKAFLIKSVGESIPLQEATVAVALFNSALDHALEPKAVLKEIHRTLKENGVLIMWQGIHRHKNSKHKTSEQETHLRVLSKNDVVCMLKDAGFSISYDSPLGCDLFPSADINKSMSTKVPRFLNRHISALLELYLFTGKILPSFASIAMLKSTKLGKNKT
jgi:SAM-dependent methyltransferase